MEWAPETRASVAKLFRTECRIYGPRLGANMLWAKRLLERGASRGIGFDELRWAVIGLPRVMRVRHHWEPCMIFNKRNQALWLEAMSAGRKAEEHEARLLGKTPLLEAINRAMGNV